jgi:hypothetical protein
VSCAVYTGAGEVEGVGEAVEEAATI